MTANLPGDAQLEALKTNLAMTMTQMSVNIHNVYGYSSYAYNDLPASVVPNPLYKPVGDGIALVEAAMVAVDAALAAFK